MFPKSVTEQSFIAIYGFFGMNRNDLMYNDDIFSVSLHADQDKAVLSTF